LTRFPGTGKSFTVIELAKQLKAVGKNVVTATTGIASRGLRQKLPEHFGAVSTHSNYDKISYLTPRLKGLICPLSLFLKEIPFASLTNAIDVKIERVLTGFLIDSFTHGKVCTQMGSGHPSVCTTSDVYRWEVVIPAFVTGFPGTGKSFTVIELAKQLKAVGKNVVVTATTGILPCNLV
jgi:Cdc6-like AAA superfamily ATPase